MARPKGTPKTGGRAKGTPNHNTTLLKDMVMHALSNAGGVKYLQRQADENPAAFMTLVGKVLPLQVNHADVAGGKLTGIEVKLIGPDRPS